ncbi:MAG: Gfo/Idh/MocA family oxidoreductase [Campylobacter sp.]|nr:Gfo/Idh/MocA family oxidoreductase [Campylobacter sp.]
MMNFAIIGVGGYIAPRHLKAIKETNNEMVCALDKSDSVGIMDSFFPNASFFTEFERFDRHLYKLSLTKDKVDFISVTTPNYLHDAHIRCALRNGADAICEKPLVLNPHNIEQLKSLENQTSKKVYNILQLRLHENIIALKKRVEDELKANPNKIYDIDLTYLTSRGKWYFISWKGDESKSGGIATNIGVHFFDMITWIFGPVKQNIVHLKKPDANAGYLELAHARVRWFLSVNYDYIPDEIKAKGQRTYRSITVDGEEIEFSGGFFDLHTRSYEKILNGEGFGLDEARNSINIVSSVRNAEISPLKGEYHEFCKRVL